MDTGTILYDNCDIDTYYKNHRDGEWGWNRLEIASLLLETHRQVVPSDAVSEFLSGGSSMNTTTLFRQFAANTDTRSALAELDKGTAINTVHMIFTQTDIPTSDSITTGWEPGYLWPMNDLTDLLSSVEAIEDEIDHQDEVIAAIHDLHNIRPRHPIVHHGQRTNNWFFNSCQECKLDQNDITVEKSDIVVEQRIDSGRASNTRPQWDGVTFDGNEVQMDGDSTLDDDDGSDHLCVCTQEHALQPPKMARGEVARALLYMNLRYGTRESLLDNNSRASPYLDLTLTDCHPIATDDYDDDRAVEQKKMNTIGYFSRLVEWHLADPPNQREIERNNAICRYYQGNRNPFVDFYEESWVLLDFEQIEREMCAGAGNERDDDDYDGTHFTSDNGDDEEKIGEANGFGCEGLMPGDISFFMVKPSLEVDGTIDLNQIEDWNYKSFGLVTLVDLEPGLVVYVVGVDDEDEDVDVTTAEGGTLKLEVPERGIPAGSFFGYGNRMYLGSEWEPILEAGEESEFSFSVHQLYLYCTDEIEGQSGLQEEYKILAALSTTGKSFGNEGLPSYWKKFEENHSGVKVSEHFTEGVHYGLIILPEDASDSEVSGGYRYDGPTYTKHDPYAKALIDEAYWKRINKLDGDEGIYKSDDEEQSNSSGENMGDVIQVQPRLDGGAIGGISRGSGRALRSPAFCAMAFATSFLPCV
eukprot:CAMPEP_0116099552 /NCGR_PEP_ID=MMETSP0327-20121206/11824_1 /TAXON_ID=44447 /ORGANISM="Pseudo-nitzschia delicatissima, Strain B596" /LENGTH=696 /DNA_ID=CAMNT_0003591427 /DNA_START=213 /DNA_END=2300 /DNA_ORIENTATION=-